jgi:hypothetical protein
VAGQNVDIDEDSLKKGGPLQATSPPENTAERQSVFDYLQTLANPGAPSDLGKVVQPSGPFPGERLDNSGEKLDNSGRKLGNQSLSDSIESESSTNQKSSTTVESLSQVETQQPESPLEQRRSTRERVPSFKLRSALSAIKHLGEPASYKDALKHQDAVQWLEAIKEEIHLLDYNKT